jgi:threonine dehydrogenase-like Zn-dependent dehydrogenase
VRAVVAGGPGRVEVADVPEPKIEGPRDAVVRVRLSAICGSDLHFFHGRAPIDPGETMGHEAVGIVEEVGPAVSTIAPGARVVTAFCIACGACWFCRRGQSQLCEDGGVLGAGVFGAGLGGAQVFLGDALPTAVHAAEVASIGPGEAVAVVGAGPIGFLAAQAVRRFEPESVLVIDPARDRLELAERHGAVPIDPAERHPQSAVFERTGGRGADVVIEAVGSAPAFERALDVVRRGGRVVVAGLYASEVFPAQLGVWWTRAIDVRFTGLCPVHSVWRRAMAEVAAGRIDPLPLVSHRLPLDRASDGYELFAGRRATKVLLVP